MRAVVDVAHSWYTRADMPCGCSVKLANDVTYKRWGHTRLINPDWLAYIW